MHKTFFSILVMVSLSSIASAQAETEVSAPANPRGIWVDAVAVAKAAPEKLEWNLQIKSTKPTVKESRAAVDASLQRLLAALKLVGLNEKTLVISDLEQGRDYEWDGNKRIFKGFFSALAIRLTVTDFTLVQKINSEILPDDLIEVRSMNQISDHEGELRQKALADAVRMARAKAEVLASTLGVKVGDPLLIVETSFERLSPWSNLAANQVQAQSVSGEDESRDGLIQEIAVRASVRVRFEISR